LDFGPTGRFAVRGRALEYVHGVAFSRGRACDA
jgi:hypothetical protein